VKIITIVLVIVAAISARGQGFLNLNFESAYNLPGNPGNNGTPVSVANALPDWAAYDGPNALSDIYYVSNSFPGASTAVELESGSLAISGNNLSVGLYSGGSISQTGLVPTNTESLQFESQGQGPESGGSLQSSDLSLTLGGQSLSYSALSESLGYTVYGANIPADLAGQMEALTFSCQGPGSGYVLFDDINFSIMSVPEPSEYALIGLGAILFGLYRRRKQERSLKGNPAKPHLRKL
jgi:hypothetical protein